MDKIYIVVRNSSDVRDYMVEIMGVFKSRSNAEKRREEIYEHSKIQTIIQTFEFVDEENNDAGN